jgi:L-lactate utilization protein LutC
MNYEILASPEIVQKVMENVKPRNITPILVQTRAEALETLKSLLPEGAELMTGSSTTLQEIGFIDLLKSGEHPWKNLKDGIAAETDQIKQAALRKQSILADYFIASVHAITESGEIFVASGSGSQVPSYAFSSNHVIWVVGTHKIVKNLDEAFKRLHEYTWPLEDKRMKSTGAPGSTIGKILIFEKEIVPMRKITLLLVNEKLGF